MQTIRVTINFHGRLAGALGVYSDYEGIRRTIQVPSPFTYKEAKEAARVSLYEPEDGISYQEVTVKSVAFN